MATSQMSEVIQQLRTAVMVREGAGPGLARTLGNLSRLAPCLIDSYIGHVDVSPHDARRPDNGED
jgi:hypothetical protein